MGPIEQSQRAKAISARRALMGHVPAVVIERVALEAARPSKKSLPHHRAKIAVPERQPLVIYSMEEVTNPLRWRVIVAEVCEKHHVSFAQITSSQRNRQVVDARFEAYYRLSVETTLSFPKIGKLLGGKDHTSVLWGVKQYKARVLDAKV